MSKERNGCNCEDIMSCYFLRLASVLIVVAVLLSPWKVTEVASLSFITTYHPALGTTRTRLFSNPPTQSNNINDDTTTTDNKKDLAENQDHCWGEAKIDYSAANEFVHAHYTQHKTSYFPSNHVMERIYNGRLGFLEEDEQTQQLVATPPSLALCGFELVKAPTAVTNFKNLEEIKTIYLSELRTNVIPKAFSSSGGGAAKTKNNCKNNNTVMHRNVDDKNTDTPSNILDVVFYHPMYRGEDQQMDGTTIRQNKQQLPTAPIASLVHIDSDIGAYGSCEEIVQLVNNNRFDDDTQSKSFCQEKIVNALKSGHRFVILNMWRNANLEMPIQDEGSPLAIMATQYKNTAANFNEEKGQLPANRMCFPNVLPDTEKSKWYTFPQMTSDECLLFLQYDRNVQYCSDLWHCALSSPKVNTCTNPTLSQQQQQQLKNNNSNNDNTPASSSNPNNSGVTIRVPRRSFDLRALVVFDEIVSPELDRFGPHRCRPILSLEESECFCESQTIQQRNTTFAATSSKSTKKVNDSFALRAK